MEIIEVRAFKIDFWSASFAIYSRSKSVSKISFDRLSYIVRSIMLRKLSHSLGIYADY